MAGTGGHAKTNASKNAASARYFPALFSASVLLDLARKGRSPVISAIARETRPPLPSGTTYSEFFEYCHNELWAHHRCEYVYKNAIATKILLGRHSLNTTRFLTEFRVGDCKADVVLINGTSTCYEIKTELDGLDRLARQLRAYSRLFDHTYVVTFPGSAQKIGAATPPDVGVLVLTDAYSISTHREAVSNRTNVDPGCIFDSLRRDEYTWILQEELGSVPAVPNTKMYAECRALFCSLPPTVAHDGMVRALKRRRVPSHIATLAETSPRALKAALLSSPLSRADAEHLTTVLHCALSP